LNKEKTNAEQRARRGKSFLKGETAANSAIELASSGTLRSEPISDVDEKYDETIFSK
jgi:hypothetical protein